MESSLRLFLIAALLLLPEIVGANLTRCNICGQTCDENGCKDNQMGSSKGSVHIADYKGFPYKFPCLQLQQQFDDGVMDVDFCPELLQYTMEPCGCITPTGEFFHEYLQKTIPPEKDKTQQKDGGVQTQTSGRVQSKGFGTDSTLSSSGARVTSMASAAIKATMIIWFGHLAVMSGC